jgi:HNH endonuclease
MAKADSPTRQCGEVDCGRPLRARGLCIGHYNARHRKPNPTEVVPCAWCGHDCVKERGRDRRYREQFCSYECRDDMRAYRIGPAHPRLLTVLPGRALVLWRPRPASPDASVATAAARLWVGGPCRECGAVFVDRLPGVGANLSRYCGRACRRRYFKRQRKAREHGASGMFTWTQVMRLHLLFDRRCAYCDRPNPDPQPDHVIPLARDGHNSIGNILPACRACNSDKRDLLLSEWSADRERRGLKPVHTRLPMNDARFRHLTAQYSE